MGEKKCEHNRWHEQKQLKQNMVGFSCSRFLAFSARSSVCIEFRELAPSHARRVNYY